MTEGKIIKWNVSVGQSFAPGDSLCSIETDKATVDFEAQEKGIIAKIFAENDETLPVGQLLAVSVRKKDDISKFADFTGKETSESVPPAEHSTPNKTEATESSDTKGYKPSIVFASQRKGIVASPAAKTAARQKGISLSEL